MKVSLHARVVIPFAVIFVALAFFAPRVPKWGYEYRKGGQWKYETLYAKFDFPILKTDAQIAAEQKEKSSGSSVPYFKCDPEVGKTCLEKVSGADFGVCAAAGPALMESLTQVYSKGVLPDEVSGDALSCIYVQKGKYVVLCSLDEIYRESDARSLALSSVRTACPSVDADSLLSAAGLPDVIRSDISFDQQTTVLFNSRKDNTVSPTLGYVTAGSVIVSQGEVVTSEIAQVLDSYKAEYDSSVSGGSDSFLVWLGNILLSLAVVVVLYYAIFFPNRKAFVSYNRLLFLLTVFSVFAALTIASMRIGGNTIFLVPFTVAALTLQAFFKVRRVLLVYMALLLPALVFCENGAMIFTMYLVAGMASFHFFPKLRSGAGQFVMALIVFAVLTLVFIAFRLCGAVNLPVAQTVLQLLVGSALTVACYPLVYLYEKVFGLVSENTLQELTDSSNELLRKLEQRAPGTFQHSLQVKNLATACARALGADELLVKAGALFHDIGKLSNPLCFVENESLTILDEGGSYHSELKPIQSAQDIIRHVTDGVELAKEYRLPKSVISFIETHHGTSEVSYFYDKFLKEGGDTSLRGEFRYKGIKPHTVEEVILMVSDSVEAASRTLRNYSPESISNLVDSIVEGKVAQGQLSEADMTIREIETMKQVMKTYIQQVHHERIKYPKRNK